MSTAFGQVHGPNFAHGHGCNGCGLGLGNGGGGFCCLVSVLLALQFAGVYATVNQHF